MMEGYVGLVGMPVKQFEGELMGRGLCVSGGMVTSVENNNTTKFARCEGCGEPIFDR